MPKGIYNRNKTAKRRRYTRAKAETGLKNLAETIVNEEYKPSIDERMDYIEFVKDSQGKDIKNINQRLDAITSTPGPKLGDMTFAKLAAENFLATSTASKADHAEISTNSIIGTLISEIERLSYQRGLMEARMNDTIANLSVRAADLEERIKAANQEVEIGSIPTSQTVNGGWFAKGDNFKKN